MILLKCSKPGCPRKKRVPRQDTDPANAVSMESRCPWHQHGDFEDPTFYDKDGKEAVWEGR